ncbi:hypothetical protein [Georgenia sp. SUBG003]|uniref:hypothetical protein n=1 Tax=Georgenia sp. SUBG003 TaxID=1497974 RepID=UPI003AB71E49
MGIAIVSMGADLPTRSPPSFRASMPRRPRGDTGRQHRGRALVNTAHQMGTALGLGILVAVSAHAGTDGPDDGAEITAHVSTALTGASVLLAAALLVVVTVIVPTHLRRRPVPDADHPVEQAPALTPTR